VFDWNKSASLWTVQEISLLENAIALHCFLDVGATGEKNLWLSVFVFQ